MMDYRISAIKRFGEEQSNRCGIPLDNLDIIVPALSAMDDMIFIEEEGKGLIAAKLVPFLWNFNYLVCQELVWWVEPQYRGTTIGIRLLKKLESEAAKLGAHTLYLCHLHEDEKMIALYKKLGYNPIEIMYEKDLTCQHPH